MVKKPQEIGTQTHTADAVCETVCETPSPNGGNGTNAAPVCKCGATLRNSTGERCANGHMLPDNTDRMIVGNHSPRFWATAEEAHREIVTQAIADSGHTTDDAPATLTITARGLAQAC